MYSFSCVIPSLSGLLVFMPLCGPMFKYRAFLLSDSQKPTEYVRGGPVSLASLSPSGTCWYPFYALGIPELLCYVI